MAHKIEELPIYVKGVKFWKAVNALLDKPRLRNDRDLHGQISRANDSIPSNMVEGFEESTDRALRELLDVLERLSGRSSEATEASLFQEIHHGRRTCTAFRSWRGTGEKMLGGFIKYLRRCDWGDRGSHNEDSED